MSKNDPNLPLREPTFYILLSLMPGPKHGYAILKDVAEISEGSLHLGTGTLYGAIKRLLEREWIRRIDEPGVKSDDRERKAYELTQQGRLVLTAEITRLRKLITAANIRSMEHTT